MVQVCLTLPLVKRTPSNHEPRVWLGGGSLQFSFLPILDSDYPVTQRMLWLEMKKIEEVGPETLRGSRACETTWDRIPRRFPFTY
jgi:hypothetical protein